jgi:hypothetical protein
MTKGDSAAWLVARRALDNRETVDELIKAMQAVTSDEVDLAHDTAAALARNGLVLVRMDTEAARDFFSRGEDV